MTKHVFAKHHRFDGEEVHTEEMIVCAKHLGEILSKRPLRDSESVQDADAELQCEFCWPGSIETGAI